MGVFKSLTKNAPKPPIPTPKPKIKPPMPKFKPDAPKFKPDAPKLKPDAPKLKPDAPKVKPDGPKVTPDAPKVKPDAPKPGMKPATKVKAAVALGIVGAGTAYIVYDAKKQTDKINNSVLNIKKIENSPENPGNIRITYDPPLLLSEDDKALFKNTNSMPNLSPVLVDITSVIDPSTIEISGKLTSAGTTGLMEPETTLANQTKLGAKQKAQMALDGAAGALGAGLGAAVSFIEKMLGLPPGTLKNIGYGILALIVLYVVYKIYSMVSPFFSKPKTAFGRRKFKGGKFSFGKLFGFGKRR